MLNTNADPDRTANELETKLPTNKVGNNRIVSRKAFDTIDVQKYIEDKMASDRAQGIESLYVIEDKTGKCPNIVLKSCVLKDLGDITYEVLDGTAEIVKFKSSNCRYKVKLPDTVMIIHEDAFSCEYEPQYAAVKDKYTGIISRGAYIDNCIKTNLGPQTASGLVGINLDNVKYIGSKAFYGCAGLQEIMLTGIITEADTHKTDSEKQYGEFAAAFRNPDMVVEHVIEDQVQTSIESKAFECCYGLNKIVLKGSIFMRDGDAFDGCLSLKVADLTDYEFKIFPKMRFMGTFISIFLPLEPEELEIIWPKRSILFDASSLVGRDNLPRITKLVFRGVSGCEESIQSEPFSIHDTFVISHRLEFHESNVAELERHFTDIARTYESKVTLQRSEDTSKIYYRYFPKDLELAATGIPALEATIYKDDAANTKENVEDSRAMTSLFD